MSKKSSKTKTAVPQQETTQLPHLQGTASITLTVKQAAPRDTNDFHWTPESKDTLRRFLAKCALEFGGRRAGKVMTVLVEKWLDGKVKVRL